MIVDVSSRSLIPGRASVEGAVHRYRSLIHNVGIVWIDGDREIVGSLATAGAGAIRQPRPARASIGCLQTLDEACACWIVDRRVKNLRIGARDSHVDPTAVGCRQSGVELGPGLAEVGRLVDAPVWGGRWNTHAGVEGA